jgi:hypothetical protein
MDMSETTDTDELKCLALIEVMAIPQERREIALGTLQLIKERDKFREIIRRAKTAFCEDGTDGEICAKMFSILVEASK